MKHSALFLATFIILSNIVFAQPAIRAVRIDTPPRIDGNVNEAVWDEAFVTTDFYQREPNLGAPVSKKTEFLVCYDENHIYFAVKCWDDPQKITAKEMARDVSLGNDDRIQIILDTYFDGRNGYWFQIGPRGSIGDALISENGAAFNKEWDGLWTGKASIKDYGWEAEVAIPFKSLGFNGSNTRWGIKYIRHIVSNIESSYWPEANLNTHKFQVSDAAILDGIENITQGIGLDISPYLITGLDGKRGENNTSKLTGGVDLFYQITPSLRSSLTINTDFAETEVDDRQINLTRFSLHFPEKRDFFLNGANYFQFGIEGDDSSPVSQRIIPFFSRRMGLDENGKPIPINYGAKLTGQHKNWNIGMLYMNDDRQAGDNNFSALRISHNLWKQSSIGIIGTYGNTLADSSNMLAGIDLKLSSSRFQGNKNASFMLFGLKSNTPNTHEDNEAWGAQFSYPNDLINARLGYHQIGKNFVAGMGFVPRVNIKESYGEFEFGPRPNKWGIMQVKFGAQFDYIQNLETATSESREFKFKPLGIRLFSGEEINYTLLNQHENLYGSFNIFREIIIPKNSYLWWRQEIAIKTKGARNIWGEATYSFGDFYSGTRKDVIIKANWKVAVPFFLGGTFIQNQVTLPQGNFTANIYQANANILFSPDITLYNFVQYDNASKNAGWQSRFQWIIKPGNEIIIAWNTQFLKQTDAFFMNESALRLKLKYNIRF
ncbi:hypothetical protein SAMN05444274_104203 [Mariniphaga anaerophila]|uniref:DUF5916 domain-containing protein n=1 Tax=Mariniphaga anaerophila TaxID=1484053 RepID=A0A1M5A7J8_9BACT|nr:carbohydrate binding family 9 domain-containing protein [Mariniphaga anaerophila]SHF25812.1 hypothetical protein SAMN05444274_104203 [Mariniphaga anaerophila]